MRGLPVRRFHVDSEAVGIGEAMKENNHTPATADSGPHFPFLPVRERGMSAVATFLEMK